MHETPPAAVVWFSASLAADSDLRPALSIWKRLRGGNLTVSYDRVMAAIQDDAHCLAAVVTQPEIFESFRFAGCRRIDGFSRGCRICHKQSTLAKRTKFLLAVWIGTFGQHGWFPTSQFFRLNRCRLVVDYGRRLPLGAAMTAVAPAPECRRLRPRSRLALASAILGQGPGRVRHSGHG